MKPPALPSLPLSFAAQFETRLIYLIHPSLTTPVMIFFCALYRIDLYVTKGLSLNFFEKNFKRQKPRKKKDTRTSSPPIYFVRTLSSQKKFHHSLLKHLLPPDYLQAKHRLHSSHPPDQDYNQKEIRTSIIKIESKEIQVVFDPLHLQKTRKRHDVASVCLHLPLSLLL